MDECQIVFARSSLGKDLGSTCSCLLIKPNSEHARGGVVELVYEAKSMPRRGVAQPCVPRAQLRLQRDWLSRVVEVQIELLVDKEEARREVEGCEVGGGPSGAAGGPPSPPCDQRKSAPKPKRERESGGKAATVCRHRPTEAFVATQGGRSQGRERARRALLSFLLLYS
eukprot:scaffold268887_cov30-Tisochrysis_lutea.AAC.3